MFFIIIFYFNRFAVKIKNFLHLLIIKRSILSIRKLLKKHLVIKQIHLML